MEAQVTEAMGCHSFPVYSVRSNNNVESQEACLCHFKEVPQSTNQNPKNAIKQSSQINPGTRHKLLPYFPKQLLLYQPKIIIIKK